MDTVLFYLAIFWDFVFRKKAKSVVPRPPSLEYQKDRELVNQIHAAALSEKFPYVAELQPQPPSTAKPLYVADFTALDSLLIQTYMHFGPNGSWTVSDWSVPGAGNASHSSVFEPSAISTSEDGLQLNLRQFASPSCIPSDYALYSTGGEIKTKQKFGFGTYEWIAKMPPAISGSVATLGLLTECTNNKESETEISFETNGNHPDEVCCSHFYVLAKQNVAIGENEWVPFGDLSDDYHKFQIVWSRNQLDFYIDDVPIYSANRNIPTAPSKIMMNHYGSNSEWGGPATLSGAATIYTERALWLKRFSYTPA